MSSQAIFYMCPAEKNTDIYFLTASILQNVWKQIPMVAAILSLFSHISFLISPNNIYPMSNTDINPLTTSIVQNMHIPLMAAIFNVFNIPLMAAIFNVLISW